MASMLTMHCITSVISPKYAMQDFDAFYDVQPHTDQGRNTLSLGISLFDKYVMPTAHTQKKTLVLVQMPYAYFVQKVYWSNH